MAQTFLSPAINVTEIDLTTIVPATATSTGAFAGPFLWGPGEEVITVSSELKLIEIFGKPSDEYFTYWFSAANFLAYSGNLKVVRSLSSNSYNAVTNGPSMLQIANKTVYEENYSDGNTLNYGEFCARYPGDIGNSLEIYVCPNANSYAQDFTSDFNATTSNVTTSSDTVIPVDVDLTPYLSVGDTVQLSDGFVQSGYIEVANVSDIEITLVRPPTQTIQAGATIKKRWKYYSSFTSAPVTSEFTREKGGKNDELHIVVVDSKGMFSGVRGTVLERFGFLSKARDAKTPDGSSSYYKNAINNRSQYIYWLSHPSYATNWGDLAIDKVFTESTTKSIVNPLIEGTNGDITDGDLQQSYDLYLNSEVVDVSLIISGPASNVLKNYLINMAERKRDAVVFLSPLRGDCVDNHNQELNDILVSRNMLISSNFAFHDSGWKYQYDKYNDVYRWVPLNGDMAGLAALTDETLDPWYSFAGDARGMIRNIVKLSWNPDKAERDELYQMGINSCVSFAGIGPQLFGDKTFTTRPSAFDRINIRRLFIVLEKSIAKAARASLFEFNDQFTRAQFVSMVEPYLRDVKGRRGLIDFKVVCDETNNTGEVIDRNEFVASIFLIPSRSINYIQLNFVAVRTNVSFSEVIGSVQ